MKRFLPVNWTCLGHKIEGQVAKSSQILDHATSWTGQNQQPALGSRANWAASHSDNGRASAQQKPQLWARFELPESPTFRPDRQRDKSAAPTAEHSSPGREFTASKLA